MYYMPTFAKASKAERCEANCTGHRAQGTELRARVSYLFVLNPIRFRCLKSVSSCFNCSNSLRYSNIRVTF